MDSSLIEDRVILGLPIETQYGELRPLSIENYLQRINSLGTLSYDKKKWLSELGKAEQNETGKTNNEIWDLLKQLNEIPMFELLKEYFKDVLHHYIILTRFCKYFYLDNTRNEYETEEEFNVALLQKSVEFLYALSNEEFDEYRQILLALHGQPEVTAFLNPSLQKREEKGNSLKSRNMKAPNLATMISSCAVYMGLDYSAIAKWNALQLQHSFQRLSYFIDNDQTTLFRTVSDEVDIIQWSQNVEKDTKTNKDMTLDQFTKNLGN